MPDIFETIAEVASVLDPKGWMLVGGLMVHAHTVKAGIPNPRPTDDADIVLEVGVLNYAQAAQSLRAIGFEPHTPLDDHEPSYRFNRGDEHIDLMVPDRSMGIRFRRRDVLAVPGSNSAIKRTERFSLADGTEVRIPDLPSSLALKGAAYRTPSADPVRHLRDGVMLFACLDGRKDLAPASKSMRANINHLLQGLEQIEAWTLISPKAAEMAVRGIRQHHRTDWTPPASAIPSRFRRTSGGR